ncbi:MAG: alpha/beta hydrolase [Pseudomonadota bacterium]
MHSHALTLRPLILGLLALVSMTIHASHHEPAEDEEDVTLFRGAANNTYFEVYFNAPPTPGMPEVAMEAHTVDLRPERDVAVHVEIFNPAARIPLILTPGGMGDCEGFRGFARNVAAAAPDLKVVIWDRRNVGLSEVAFGPEPANVEEGEDLHVLIERLKLAPAALYGMSSGARSNLILAERYPEDVAALIIAPLTGGPLAATRLAEEYFHKYLETEALSTMEHISPVPLNSMQAVGETPLWAAYLARSSQAKRARFMAQDIARFRAAMQTSGDHLKSFADQTALGMTDVQLKALQIPATLLLHHGVLSDRLHPLTNTRAAAELIPNARYVVAPYLPEILTALLPFVRELTPAQQG